MSYGIYVKIQKRKFLDIFHFLKNKNGKTKMIYVPINTVQKKDRIL